MKPINSAYIYIKYTVYIFGFFTGIVPLKVFVQISEEYQSYTVCCFGTSYTHIDNGNPSKSVLPTQKKQDFNSWDILPPQAMVPWPL